MKRKKEVVVEERNNSLLNVITPMGLSFTKNTMTIGEHYAKIYGIIHYPGKMEIGWLSRITNLPSSIVSINFKPIDNSLLINAISKSVTRERGLADSTKDTLERQRAEKSAEDGEKIIEQIDREGETVGLMSVSVMPLSKDERIFQKVCRRCESAVSILKCKMRVIPNLQKESLMHIAPSFPSNEKIESILERIVPFSTFIGGFPFAGAGFHDPTGYYFAKDSSGGLVVVDPWKRGSDRTNTNMVIMGIPGTGKSTAIKSIILSEYMKGTKILSIDPESEYKDLCRKSGGTVVNAVGGSKGMINPLQVRPAPKDDDEELDILYQDEGQGLNDLALHMKTLEIFFNLYIPSITDMQRALLKDCLLALYEKFGITWSTNVESLKATDFPIFKDLYDYIVEKAEETKNDELIDLSILLKDIAEGADSFIWNGHTTVESESNFICFDTHELQGTSDNIKRTQYFNLLTVCWEIMSRNRDEKVLLVCDEAYLMIDTKVPQSLIYLRNVMKRARKYEGALAIISHSVIDFLSESIKQYGQALLDVPTYKILLGTDGQNLKETAKLYDLTEAEQELLLSRKRGHALFMVGAKRLHINFELPQYKLDYMGSAGGR